jgi:hypothetical protein
VQAFRIAVATVVVLVWLTGYVLAFYKGADQPDGLNVLMGLVLGWVFGGAGFDLLKRIRFDKDDPKDKHAIAPPKDGQDE